MNIYIPYTYLIKFIPTQQVYYGVRYSKDCSPTDLWTTYFTSSKIVKQLIKDFGIESFEYEIRKTFNNKKDAQIWESKVLRRMDVSKNQIFLNMSNGYGSFYYHPDEVISEIEKARKEKISLKMMGRKKTEITKQKISEARKGYKQTKEHRLKNPARKNWKVTSPSGEIFFVEFIEDFCKENGLSRRAAKRSASTKKVITRGKSAGWLFESFVIL